MVHHGFAEFKSGGVIVRGAMFELQSSCVEDEEKKKLSLGLPNCMVWCCCHGVVAKVG